jgi:hypothetical protein
MATKSAVKTAIKESQVALKGIAQRWVNAEIAFKENIVEQFGFTSDEADIIFRVYSSKKAKLIKYSNGTGTYQFSQGGFWEKEVMQNAIKFASDFIK